jgi:galactokinase
VWSAPGRVNLIGEHTDYNGGLCLPTALPHRTYAAFARRDDDGVRLASAQLADAEPWTGTLADLAPGRVSGFAAYAGGVAWSLAADGLVADDARTGFDAFVDSCVPFGSGLSSSASLECAFAVAFDDAWSVGAAATPEGRSRLVSACIRTENEVAGAPTGGLDQSASLLTSAAHALLLDFRPTLSRTEWTRQVPFDPEALGLELLVVDTRVEHQHADGQYAARRATCEAAAEALGVATLREISPDGLDDALGRLSDDVARRRVRHVVTENARVEEFVGLLEGAAGLDGAADARTAVRLGALLDESHASLRDDYEITCVELDVAVEAARDAGAFGARMTGGGFGGSIVAFVPPGTNGAVAQAVADAFAEHGFTAPAALEAPPSDAAGRDV